MKKVRNLVVLFISALTVGLMSCTEAVSPDAVDEASAALSLDYPSETDTQNWDGVASESLPQSVIDYIAENYPDATIEESWFTDESEYVVKLTGHTVLVFDASGEFVEEVERGKGRGKGHHEEKGDTIAIEDLSQAIKDYIATNYADDAIESARIHEDETHVRLESGIVVVFDADDNFVEEKEPREGDDKEHKGSDHEKRRPFDDWTQIEIADLPASVTDYISSNYPDATIELAATSEDGEYGVLLDSHVALVFDASGTFVESHEPKEGEGPREDCKDVAESDLPSTITAYISENHPDAAIEKAHYHEGRGEYKVELTNNLVLVFDKDGNFVKEENEG